MTNRKKPAEVTQLASMALESLLYEVVVNPKPGLVDPVDVGPHPDMNVFMFIDSAVSLRGYLEACVSAGYEFDGDDLTELFQTIRGMGIKAEETMFEATHHVNTHKGAVFSLGILATATAYQARIGDRGLKQLQQIIREMLQNLITDDLATPHFETTKNLTAGERQYLKYGLLGVRGEAAAGFPVVFDYAVPFLEKRTGPLNARLLDTLLLIVLHADDSNLIKRSGDPHILKKVRQKIRTYFELGGYQTEAGYRLLQDLNTSFKNQNLSLGGSADLLILTIFVGLETGIVVAK